VVEGQADEPACFKHIFTDIFGYKTIQMNRRGQFCEYGKKETGTAVIIANTVSTNIKAILDDSERERMLISIQEYLGESLKNYRIYYIWDRDRESNKKSDIEKAISKHKNALLNDESFENGLLLLSYPCYEAFLVSNFENTETISGNIKQYIKSKRRIKVKHISKDTLERAATKLWAKLQDLHIEPKLDDMSLANGSLLRKEEEYYRRNNVYFLISQLSLLFIDLGLLEECASN
jgi:hypothetical protein